MKWTRDSQVCIEHVKSLKGFDLLSKKGKNILFREYKYSYPVWEEIDLHYYHIDYFDRFIKYKILQPVWTDLNYSLFGSNDFRNISEQVQNILDKIDVIIKNMRDIEPGQELWGDAPTPEDSHYLPDEISLSLFFESIGINDSSKLPTRFDDQPFNNYNYLKNDIQLFRNFINNYLCVFVLSLHEIKSKSDEQLLKSIMNSVNSRSMDNYSFLEEIPKPPSGHFNVNDLYLSQNYFFRTYIHNMMKYSIEKSKKDENKFDSDKLKSEFFKELAKEIKAKYGLQKKKESGVLNYIEDLIKHRDSFTSKYIKPTEKIIKFADEFNPDNIKGRGSKTSILNFFNQHKALIAKMYNQDVDKISATDAFSLLQFKDIETLKQLIKDNRKGF